jgi:hypothetical protein
MLFSHAKLAESGNENVFLLFQGRFHDLENGFHELRAVGFGKTDHSQLVMHVFHDPSFGEGHERLLFIDPWPHGHWKSKVSPAQRTPPALCRERVCLAGR